MTLLLSFAAVSGAFGQTVSDPLPLLKEGSTLVSEGKYDEALALSKRALAADPKSYGAHLVTGIVMDLKGDYAAARQHLSQAIEVAPEAARDQALVAMAISYAFEAKAADAAKYYQKVFDKQLAAQGLDAAAGIANALGRIYLESGDAANAEKWYRTGYETAKKQTNLKPEQVDLWEMRWLHAQARISARRGNSAEADRHTAALKIYIDKITPGGPNADQLSIYPYLVGYVAFYLKNYDVAITELQKADQNDPFILGVLAQAHEHSGDKTKARAYYEKVLASHGHTINTAFSRPVALKALSGRAGL